jgi:hypothetical protein
LLVAALLAFSWVLAVAPRAHGAANMEVAVQDDPLFVGDNYYGRGKGLQHARQLGATRIRVNLSWTSVMPASQSRARKKPRTIRWDFAEYDALVAATNGTDVRVQLALVGPAPAWATGDKKVGPYKVKAKYFGEFAKRAAQQYGQVVDRWSIWNEPNHVAWLAPYASARNYRKMYVEGYNAIKAANSSAQVLIAETSPYAIVRRGKKNAQAPLAFVRDMVCANRTFTRARCGLKADGFAHHPYDFDHPPSFKFPGADNVTINTLGRLTSALDRLARAKGLQTPSGGALDLYLTEYGYFRSGDRGVPESRRSKYLVQGFEIAQKNPRVREMLQYLLAQPPRKYRFFDTSIVSTRGKVSKSFKALQNWARGALSGGRIANSAVLAFGGAGGGQPPYQDPNAGSGSPPAEGGGGGSGGTPSPGTTPPSNPPPNPPPPPDCSPLPICPPTP